MELNLNFKNYQMEKEFQEHERERGARVARLLATYATMIFIPHVFLRLIPSELSVLKTSIAVLLFAFAYILPLIFEPQRHRFFKFSFTIFHAGHAIWTIMYEVESVEYLVAYSMFHCFVTRTTANFVFRRCLLASVFIFVNFSIVFGSIVWGLKTIERSERGLILVDTMIKIICYTVGLCCLVYAGEKERRKLFSEEKISQQRSQSLHQVLTEAPIGVVICNLDFSVEYVNTYVSALLGHFTTETPLSFSLISSQPLQESKNDDYDGYKTTTKQGLFEKNRFGGEDDLCQFVSIRSDSMESEEDEDLQTLFQCLQTLDLAQLEEGKVETLGEYKLRNSPETFLEISAQYISWNGERRIFLSIHDISLIKKALNDVKQMNKLKMNWMRTVSHELKTPLNAILGSFDIITDKADEETRHWSLAGHNAAELLLSYVGDLIDYFQIQTNTFCLNLREFNLPTLVKRCSQLYQTKANEKEIVIQCSIDPCANEVVVNDEYRLRQIILNLLNNAIKFTPEKGVVDLRVSEDEDSEDSIRISVADTGIGMSEQEVSSLFREFGTIDSETHRQMNPQGVGIGLWIAQHLSESVGGSKIEVVSSPTRGSEFSFVVSTNITRRDEENTTARCSGPSLSSVRSRLMSIDLNKELKSHRSLPIKKPGPIRASLSMGKIEDSLLSQNVVGSKYSEVRRTRSPGDRGAHKYKNYTELSTVPTTQGKYMDDEEGFAEVLIVDDDPTNRLILSTLLSRLGVSHDIACDGRESVKKVTSRWEKATSVGDSNLMSQISSLSGGSSEQGFKMQRDEGYRLVFMDYSMPVLCGPSATEEILLHAEEKKKIPPVIVGYTAYTAAMDSNTFKRAGAIEILPKPVKRAELVDILRKYGVQIRI